jgi:hypothetical protein
MRTRRGVPICKAGTYPLSTGLHTFTRAQFEAAIRNAAKRSPRIGIGHTDPRWSEIDASKDGEPALGLVENLRLADDGDVLVGDYVDMPNWFADALPTSYPGRSVEGTCPGDDLTVTAVKVLGMTMPGIDSLEDLRRHVSDEGPALVAAGADNNGRQITVVFGSESTHPEEKESNVTVDYKLLREALGLPQDATMAQVKAKAEAHMHAEAQETTKVLQAAVAEGKIGRSHVPEWRRKYEANPQQTRAWLRQITSIDPKIIAAGERVVATESELQRRTRVALGLEPSSGEPSSAQVRAAADTARLQAASDALSRGERAQLMRTKHGTVTYGTAAEGSVPTKLSERGTRQVFHNSDWIDVDEFERMGLTPRDSALEIALVRSAAGATKSRERLAEGIPSSAALLGL